MHDCPVEGCPKRVPTHLLMCPTHWWMVPAHLRNAVWRTYRRDGVLSDSYTKARQEAIAHVDRALADRASDDPQPAQGID